MFDLHIFTVASIFIGFWAIIVFANAVGIDDEHDEATGNAGFTDDKRNGSAPKGKQR